MTKRCSSQHKDSVQLDSMRGWTKTWRKSSNSHFIW